MVQDSYHFVGKTDPKFPAAKLTPDQKEEIRDRYQAGASASDLASEFGVTASRIRQLAGARAPGTRRKRQP